MRCLLAIRVFFRVLFDRDFARRVESLGGVTAADEPGEKPVSRPGVSKAKPKPQRSEAISLLAALQREGRLVDFLQEPLDDYTDAQIGAAARDVHRDSGNVLRRMFELVPVVDEPEGATVEVPSGYDAGCYRLTGNVTGEPPFRGQMVHHGWRATTCQVPQFSGGKDALLVVAPAEIELK
ncbi:MAG: DUF2760 domain-containing protein [Pirellulales bacterium]|nr:DUF2760 domain-containing protein [Pirellulales bacterium]